MTYIHPDSRMIEEFIQENIRDKSNLRAVCDALFSWFDEKVRYSRLNAPFFPLQRSDLDVISMRSGTCGDFSNLIVSVLQRLGYEAMYAYVHKDCYGDDQDHICAAVLDGAEWILIDATQPYRKWHGFRCRHQEYELLSPDAFTDKMKKEETYWTNAANRYGNGLFAGLLYAPWIHEEFVRETETVLESVFYLLSMNEDKRFTLYAYYKRYTKEKGSNLIMAVISELPPQYCFSCKPPATIWDNDQWSQAYSENMIPSEWKTATLCEFRKRIADAVPTINLILRELCVSDFRS